MAVQKYTINTPATRLWFSTYFLTYISSKYILYPSIYGITYRPFNLDITTCMVPYTKFFLHFVFIYLFFIIFLTSCASHYRSTLHIESYSAHYTVKHCFSIFEFMLFFYFPTLLVTYYIQFNCRVHSCRYICIMSTHTLLYKIF